MGRADAGADQQERSPGLVEDEGAARRGDVEPVPDGEPGVQVAARGAVLLALDREPVVAGVRASREGVVAQQGSLLLVGPHRALYPVAAYLLAEIAHWVRDRQRVVEVRLATGSPDGPAR